MGPIWSPDGGPKFGTQVGNLYTLRGTLALRGTPSEGGTLYALRGTPYALRGTLYVFRGTL